MASATATVVSQKYGQAYGYNSNTACAGFNYDNQYYPFILQFKTPEITGRFTSTSIDFNLSMLQGARNNAASSTVSLRYAILTSDSNYNSYLFTTDEVDDDNQIPNTSGIVTFTGLTAAWQTMNLNIATTALESNTTYYLILWGDNSGGYNQDYANVNTPTNHSVTLWYENTYTVQVHHVKENGFAIFATNETVTVLDGKTFTPTVITPPDENTTGGSWFKWWTGDYVTVLGTGATGEDSITVTQDIVVEVYYPLRTYTLTVSQDACSIISVKKGGEVLSSGATITHGDVLTIVFGADTGYELDIHTVNGSTFASGGTHTVTSDVLVVSTASPLGLVYIDNGTSWSAYQVYIDNGTSWDLYIPYIDNGTSWDLMN